MTLKETHLICTYPTIANVNELTPNHYSTYNAFDLEAYCKYNKMDILTINPDDVKAIQSAQKALTSSQILLVEPPPNPLTPIEALIQKYSLTIESTFVPFSFSRSSQDKYPSLNYNVSLKAKGKTLLTFPYSKGSGHTLASKINKNNFTSPSDSSGRIAFECEKGYCTAFGKVRKTPVLTTSEVLYSLISDAFLGAESFEDFCDNIGANPDSIKDLASYKECERTYYALNSLGKLFLTEAAEAFQDF